LISDSTLESLCDNSAILSLSTALWRVPSESLKSEMHIKKEKAYFFASDWTSLFTSLSTRNPSSLAWFVSLISFCASQKFAISKRLKLDSVLSIQIRRFVVYCACLCPKEYGKHVKPTTVYPSSTQCLQVGLDFAVLRLQEAHFLNIAS
jgi:hypothetical protein